MPRPPFVASHFRFKFLVVFSLTKLSTAAFTGVHQKELKSDGDLQSSSSTAVLFAAHHKTGTLLAKEVAACLNHHGQLFVNVSNHYEGEDATQNFTKIVHFVRNPVSVIVSSFLYHRDKGERWGNWHGSAKSIVNNSFMGKDEIEIGDRETYKELLNRVTTERGLLIEIRRFLRPPSYSGQASMFGHEALQMRAAHNSCLQRGRTCVAVCLEDFMRNSSSFNASWSKALEHIGVNLDAPDRAKLRECVARADVHSGTFAGHEEHVTENAVTPAGHAKLERLVRELDAGWQDYAVKALEDQIGCH